MVEYKIHACTKYILVQLETMNSIIINAYAKVNLGLDVTGVRPNGYHDVKMIMHQINLYDTIELTKANSDISFTLADQKTDTSLIGPNSDNLCVKAARLLFEQYNITSGLKIRLTKRIPIAAGLAGGSTDAAAVFKGINELFELGLSTQELMDISVKLGADIPFCILGGTALSEGIGEILTPLPSPNGIDIRIIKPDFGLSTKEVYTKLDSIFSDIIHPDIDAQVEALKTGDIDKLISNMGNVLEQVSIMLHPQIQEIKEKMLSDGAIASMMSGSGPTVFGIWKTN